MKPLTDLEPGDLVITIRSLRGSLVQKIETVKKVTKTGQVTLENGSRFLASGYEIGSKNSPWSHSSRIEVATDEKIKIINLSCKRQKLRADLMNLKTKLHDDCSLSDEQAIEILSTIIPGLQALIQLQESTLKTVTDA